jgi:GTP-sensing pleiotropic transcriptional regulator CodY
MYPAGWPLAMLVNRMGVPLLVRVYVTFDEEAKVFIADSPDVQGLLLEGESLDEIEREARDVTPHLLAPKAVERAPGPRTKISYLSAPACA